jgi:hypothetical protein
MKQNQFYSLPVLSLIAGGIIFFSACKKDTPESQSAPIRPVTSSSNKYVTALFEYLPAPGQSINTSLGDSTGARAILANKDAMVTLGAWGGFIVLGFDHTVLNKPDTADIMIYANAFSNLAEPGVIWVMADQNGNGKPDDTWYELAGSAFGQAGYKRNYSVTYSRPDSATEDVPWTDNLGQSGVVKVNDFHSQPYFPEWISGDTYTLTGSLLPSVNIDDSNPSYIISTSFAFGYADNTGGGDMVDLDNAIDINGNAKSLKGIDFIRIQTGIQYNMGWLGEQSTEVSGVADISMGLDN